MSRLNEVLVALAVGVVIYVGLKHAAGTGAKSQGGEVRVIVGEEELINWKGGLIPLFQNLGLPYKPCADVGTIGGACYVLTVPNGQTRESVIATLTAHGLSATPYQGAPTERPIDWDSIRSHPPTSAPGGDSH